jgi:hypothetical protein
MTRQHRNVGNFVEREEDLAGDGRLGATVSFRLVDPTLLCASFPWSDEDCR